MASSNLVAVVAGAGSGIGRATALCLAARGYDVVLVGRTESKLKQVDSEISESGGRSQIFAADVSDWDRMAELAQFVGESGIDVLVNSAGGQFAQPSEELTEEGWRSILDKNLSGSFFLCRHLYQALRSRRGSAVMVVANMWERGAPNLVHSAAARAGVVNMTRTLALEWAADGIRLNAVAPGLTDTEALLEQYRTSLAARVPLGRIGKPEEVADTIIFLARSQYITGEVVSHDGGLRLAR